MHGEAVSGGFLALGMIADRTYALADAQIRVWGYPRARADGLGEQGSGWAAVAGNPTRADMSLLEPGEARRSLIEALVAGERAGVRATVGIEEFSDRVEPHSPGLRARMWYGGASLRSAQWAGEHGMNLLTSSVVRAEQAAVHEGAFAEIQAAQIETFRAHHPDGAAARVSQGLVVVPTDTATPAQRAKYEA